MTRKSESSTSIEDPFNQFIANLKKEMKNELQLKVYEDSERSFSSTNTSSSRSQLLKNELKLKGSSKSSTGLALPSLTTSLSKLGFSVPKLRLKDLKVELDDDHFQNRDYLKWGSLRSTFASPDQIEAEESRSRTKFKLPPINSPRFGNADNYDDDVDGKLKNDLYKLNDSILKKIKNELGPAITLKSDPAKNKRLKLPLLPGIVAAEGKASRSLEEIKGELIELNKKIDKVGAGKNLNVNVSDAERKAKEKLKLIAKEFQKELDGSMDPKILIKTPRSPKKNPTKCDGEIEKAETGSKSEEKSFSSEKRKKVHFSESSTSTTTVSDNESFVSEMRSFLEDYEKKPTREPTPELEPESLDFPLDNYGQGRPTTAGSSSTIKRIPMSMSMMSRSSVDASTDHDNSQLTSDMTTMTNPVIKKISLLDRWKIESLPLDAESLKQLQTTQTSSKENENAGINAGNCVNAFFHGNGCPRSLMDLRGDRDLSYTDQILLRKLRESSSQTQIQI